MSGMKDVEGDDDGDDDDVDEGSEKTACLPATFLVLVASW